jgi:hypothetical protein
MTCERCQGLMVRTQHYGLSILKRILWIWKCVNCGNVLDHTVIMNREQIWETGQHPSSGKAATPRIHCLPSKRRGKHAA